LLSATTFPLEALERLPQDRDRRFRPQKPRRTAQKRAQLAITRTGCRGRPYGSAVAESDKPLDDAAQDAENALETVEHELAVLLRRARAFSGQFAREFHPDLDAGAYVLMIWLDDVGSARLTDMATFFGVGKPTVSRQIQLLERLDLVTRTVDDTDRRAQSLSLTADGAARLRLVRTARRDRFRTLFAPWPDQDIAVLGDLLGRLNQSMGTPNPELPPT